MVSCDIIAVMIRRTLAALSIPALVAVAGFLIVRAHAQTATPPPMPQWISLKAPSACETQLNWKETAPADYFVMSVNGDPANLDNAAQAINGVSCGAANGCANLTTTTLSLDPGTSYSYALKAGKTAGGESGWTNQLFTSTPSIQKPQTPTNVTGDWDASGRLALSWNPLTLKNGGYRVLVSGNGGRTYGALSNGTFPSSVPLPFLLTGMSTTTAYYYEVAAYQTDTGCFTGNITDTANGVAQFSDPSAPLIVPAAPQGLSATASQTATTWQVKFSWSKANGAGQYELQIASDAGFTSGFGGQPMIDRTTDQTSDTEQFSANVPIYYRVRATAASGPNTGHSMYTVGANVATGVPAPQNLAAQAGAATISGGTYSEPLTLSWDNKASLMPRSYEIYQSVDGGSFALVGTNRSQGQTAPATTYSVGTISSPHSYQYKVRVTTPNSGNSDYSNIVTLNLQSLKVAATFSGQGWSAYLNGATGNNTGISWISLNSADPGVNSAHPYGVWASGTAAPYTLHGEAWASITVNGKESYGWLSFDSDQNVDGRNDLAGCLSGSCTATMDASGTISGWARFIAMTANTGGWDGWVLLRGNAAGTQYGTCYGHATSTASGTWKGTVNDPQNPGKTIDYYTGAKCAGDGGTTINGSPFVKLTGLAWAGPTIGGWVMWDPSDNTVTSTAPVTPPTGTQTLTIVPPGPFTLAYYEAKSFAAEDKNGNGIGAKWYAGPYKGPVATSIGDAVPGGNAQYGTIAPTETAANASALYTAPASQAQLAVFASSTAGSAVSFVQVNVVPPYALSCAAAIGTSDTINVAWQAMFSNPTYPSHQLALYQTSGASRTWICTGATASSGSGQCSVTGLKANTPYSFELDTKYGDPSKPMVVATAGPCTTGGATSTTSDAPSQTHAYGYDNRTIYVNWKDNTTTTVPYHFEVQRITLTPASSTDAGVTGATSDQISLRWGNYTSSTPYTNSYDRSTSTDQGIRFSATKDPSLVTRSGLAGSSNPNTTTELYYSASDPVRESTTYYYRLYACSSVNNGNIAPYYTPAGDVKNGDIATPSPVCSIYTTVMKGPKGAIVPIATTTPPTAPTQLTATSVSPSEIDLSWTNNSVKNSGFMVYENGTPLTTQNGGPTLPARGTTGTMTYAATNLSSDAVYTFEVRAIYDYTSPWDGTASRVYSDASNSATDATCFDISTSANPGNGGTVSTSVSPRISCSKGGYGANYPSGVTVSPAANPTSGYQFDSWSGSCANQGASCSLDWTPGSGNVDTTANFSLIPPPAPTTATLTAAYAGAQGTVVSSPAGIVCGPADTRCSATYTVPTGGLTVWLTGYPWNATVVFDHWDGGTGSSTCVAANTQSTCSVTFYPGDSGSVTAYFKPQRAALPQFFASIGEVAKGAWRILFGGPSSSSQADVASAWDGIASAAGSFWSNIASQVSSLQTLTAQLGTQAGSYIVAHTPVASGQDTIDLYFAKFDKKVTVPVYVDTSLTPDTVYLYRVRAVYDDGSGRVTAWDNLGAAKTLRDVAGTLPSSRPVCTRNSYCDFSMQGFFSGTDPNASPKQESSLQQCAMNADCRNVGRAGQTYQEK